MSDLQTGYTWSDDKANWETNEATAIRLNRMMEDTQMNILAGSNVTVTRSSSGVTIASTAAGTGTVTSVAATAGTGITVSGSPITTSGTLTITNSAPDQTVALTASTGISTSGTYPNFTITNSAPDQTVAIAAGTGISVSGTYPNFTVTNSSPSSGGTVTSVGGTGTVNGITLSGTVTSSGNLTLGGTLSGVNLTSQVTGVLPQDNGGTGDVVIDFLLSDGTDNWNYTQSGYSPNQQRLAEVLCGDIDQIGYPIETIILTEGGGGYTDGTYAFTVTGGTGTSAAGRVQVANNQVVMTQIQTAGSGYRIIPGQIWYEPSVGFILNSGDRGISTATPMNALLPNGVSITAASLFPAGTTLTGKTYTTFTVLSVTYTKWVLTFSQSPIGGAGYYTCAFGIPTVVASIGSGGGFDYRFILANRRNYRIPAGSYFFSEGFELAGINNAHIDCTGALFYTNGLNNQGILWSDTCTDIEILGLRCQNRYSGGTLDPSSRGDGMPCTLRGSFNIMRNCGLESGGDFGLIIGGDTLRSYNLQVLDYDNRSSWGDCFHVGNINGLTINNFESLQSGDDVIALYSDAGSVAASYFLNLTQPTFVGGMTFVNVNSAGSGYTNGTFLCNAVTGAAQANITVAGGIITSGTVANAGSYSTGPLFDLTPLGAGTGGQVQAHLTWSSITGSWAGANYNLFQRVGYRTTMTFTDSLYRMRVVVTMSNTNSGSLTTTATFEDGGFGFTAQPDLYYSKGGNNVVVTNGRVKKGSWRGILIGPYNWENIIISSVSFDGIGSNGIVIGSGTDSYVAALPEQKSISLSALAFNGVGVAQYRTDVTANVAKIFKVNGGSFIGITISGSDNSTFLYDYCSNMIIAVSSSMGATTYSGTNSTNVTYATSTQAAQANVSLSGTYATDYAGLQTTINGLLTKLRTNGLIAP